MERKERGRKNEGRKEKERDREAERTKHNTRARGHHSC